MRNLGFLYSGRSSVVGTAPMTTAEHPRFLVALGMTVCHASYAKVCLRGNHHGLAKAT